MLFVRYKFAEQHSPHNTIAHAPIFNHKCSADTYHRLPCCTVLLLLMSSQACCILPRIHEISNEEWRTLCFMPTAITQLLFPFVTEKVKPKVTISTTAVHMYCLLCCSFGFIFFFALTQRRLVWNIRPLES